jgi:sulfite exporter TauE/SafE
MNISDLSSLIPEQFSRWIYLGPFIAGIFSITHCSVMCGPLVLVFRDRKYAYHGGRIFGYTLVGAALGTIGMSIDRAGSILTLQNLSIYLSGGLLIIYGLIRLLPGQVWRKIPAPGFLYAPARWISKVRSSGSLPASISVFLAGVLSALIPCAILYPLWALAAGSGSPTYGAGIAFAFVTGTIPGLLFIQWMADHATGKLKRFTGQKLRVASVVIMVITGVAIIGFRNTSAPKMDFSENAVQDPTCLPGEEGGDDFEVINPSKGSSENTGP